MNRIFSQNGSEHQVPTDDIHHTLIVRPMEQLWIEALCSCGAHLAARADEAILDHWFILSTSTKITCPGAKLARSRLKI